MAMQHGLRIQHAFLFAVGGKDGRPYPIDEQAFDETIGMLQNSVG